VYTWQVDSEVLDLVALYRLLQLICPAVCVEHVHDLQGDSATVHRAACIAKLTRLAAVKGPILAPSQEDVDYTNHAHTKIIMLQVQVLPCRCSSLHGGLPCSHQDHPAPNPGVVLQMHGSSHNITEPQINMVLDMGHRFVVDKIMTAQTAPSWPSPELCVRHLHQAAS